MARKKDRSLGFVQIGLLLPRERPELSCLFDGEEMEKEPKSRIMVNKKMK